MYVTCANTKLITSDRGLFVRCDCGFKQRVTQQQVGDGSWLNVVKEHKKELVLV